MASIEAFYRDSAMRDNVKAFLQKHLEKKALEKVFNKEDTSHIAEAREVIDEAFEAMADIFEPKPERPSISPR